MRNDIFSKESRIPIKSIIFVGFLPSFLKKIIYRLKGYKIGKNVKFNLGSIILAKNKCVIGDNSKFGFLNVIVVNELEIGKNANIKSFTFIKTDKVKIGKDVIISENVVINAGHPSPFSKISLDDRVHIFPYAILDSSYPIHIGEETGIGLYTGIYTHGAYKNILDGYPVTYGEVKIGKRVELTYSVLVAPGVTIGDDVIVAYGSYVNKDIPDGVLAAGTPAKVKRTKEEFAPTPSIQNKLRIIIEILNNFFKKLNYFYNYTFEKSNPYTWTLVNTNQIYKIHLFENFKLNPYYNSNDIVLVLNPICMDTKNDLKKRKIQWFDFSTYSCYYLNDFGDVLKSYFGRYGIRFTNND